MNNPEPDNLRRSKSSLVLFLVSVVLLVIVGGYLGYAQQQEQASQGSTNLVLNNSQTELKEIEAVNQVTNETTPASTENKQTETRDPNRYYNDKDGYSFIVPEGLKAKPASEVYPENSTVDFSDMIAINAEFPESVRLGGSDWLPTARIVVIEGYSKRDTDCKEVTINQQLLDYCILPSPDFGVTDYFYILRKDNKEYLIASFKKEIADQIVNSFELL